MFCRWREALLVVQLARLSSSLVELPEPSVLPVLPEMRQVWLGLPYLLQVWHILTILAANLATRAQLGAFPAALFRQHQLGVILAALLIQT